MKSLWIAVTLLLASARPGFAQDSRSKKDLERLQGAWNVVSLEMDGRTLTGADLGGAMIRIQGDHFTSSAMGADYEGTIELDSTASPKTLGLKFLAGPEKGAVNRGIYELDGDTWRICIATRGAARPHEFVSRPGTGIALEVLKRAENARSEAAPELAGEWSMVSGSYDGRPLDENYTRRGKRVVEGNTTVVTLGGEIYSKATYTVDRSKTPAAIDIHNSAGAYAGKTQYGIYEVDRRTLKLSIASPGRERPSDFSSTPGDGRAVVIWTRSRPAAGN